MFNGFFWGMKVVGLVDLIFLILLWGIVMVMFRFEFL